MKAKLVMRMFSVLLFCLFAQAAFSQVEGMTTATAPALTTGDTISAYATGDLWADYSNELFSARLYVDGTLVWSNGGKGVILPTSWPGLVFTYEPTYTLTPGSHTVVWEGTYNPVILPHTGILWYYSVVINAP